MRVVCINDENQEPKEPPFVIKGNIYTVLDIEFCEKDEDEECDYPAGNYFTLVELGDEYFFHESIFIQINETEVDESEMVNVRQIKPKQLTP